MVYLLQLALIVCAAGECLVWGHLINTANHHYHSSIIEDETHIRNHLQEFTNIGHKKLSREEMDFHFFKLHDFNNDTLLDGLELLAAMFHSQASEDLLLEEKQEDEEELMKGKSREQMKKFRKEKREKVVRHYADIIDEVFEKDDLNDDGYLDYQEFTRSHRQQYHHNNHDHDHNKHHKNHKDHHHNNPHNNRDHNKHNHHNNHNNNHHNSDNPHHNQSERQHHHRRFHRHEP